MKNSRKRALWICGIFIASLIGLVLIVAARSTSPMLFQHGNPEVPGGRAFVIMNPFRNQRPEEIAEQLISDLRTSRCEQILRDLHSDDARICPVMRENESAQLIWREDGELKRDLAYNLAKSKSILWITSSREDIGFFVSDVAIIR